jgi:hypothetical protein
MRAPAAAAAVVSARFATTRHTNTQSTSGAAAKIISTSLGAVFHNAQINRLTKGGLIFHDRILPLFYLFTSDIPNAEQTTRWNLIQKL